MTRPPGVKITGGAFPRGKGLATPMFEITRERTFSASHQLRNYKGKCERLHGHNWRVRVCVASPDLDEAGMVIDFHMLDELMQRAIEPLDHCHLNDVPVFAQENPSAENIARIVGDSVREALRKTHIELRHCDVWENDLSRARYIPEPD